MKLSFDEFIKIIPKNIHSNTKTYIGKNIAVFIPEEFVVERELKITDYHFVLFQTTPPLIKIDDVEYKFKKGSFICIEPNVRVSVNPIQSVGIVKFISISIDKDFFEKLTSYIIKNGKNKFNNKGNAYSHQLLELIELFIKEIISFGESCTLMLESIETQISIQLLRDSFLNSLTHTSNYFTDNDYIEQSIKYMHEYYSSNITIKEICNIIFISHCHFQRIFKKSMKQTPYNYLMRVRIDNAKKKLLESNDNIKEIGRLCGFLSISHFSAVFKRIEGISPSEYKRNNSL
jgi:AraC-like DNA-binding protein